MEVTHKENVKFKKKIRGPRGTKYEDILELLRNLGKNNALILTPDEGMTVLELKTRIWSAMYRAGLLDKNPTDRYYATRTTDDNKLAVIVKTKKGE